MCAQMLQGVLFCDAPPPLSDVRLPTSRRPPGCEGPPLIYPEQTVINSIGHILWVPQLRLYGARAPPAPHHTTPPHPPPPPDPLLLLWCSRSPTVRVYLNVIGQRCPCALVFPRSGVPVESHHGEHVRRLHVGPGQQGQGEQWLHGLFKRTRALTCLDDTLEAIFGHSTPSVLLQYLLCTSVVYRLLFSASGEKLDLSSL